MKEMNKRENYQQISYQKICKAETRLCTEKKKTVNLECYTQHNIF